MGFVFECAPTNALTWGLFVACLERNVLRTFESTISLSFQREKPSNNNSEFLSFFKNPFVILICLLWLLEGRSNSSSAINARTDDGVGLLYACPNPTIRYEIWKGPKLKVASYVQFLSTYLLPIWFIMRIPPLFNYKFTDKRNQMTLLRNGKSTYVWYDMFSRTYVATSEKKSTMTSLIVYLKNDRNMIPW